MTTDHINISGIDKAELLAGLYNGTNALGIGALHDRGVMTVDMARAEIEADSQGNEGLGRGTSGSNRALYFDYVLGRPIKSDLSGDSFDPRLYDRDAGPGAAAEVVSKIRAAQLEPADG